MLSNLHNHRISRPGKTATMLLLLFMAIGLTGLPLSSGYALNHRNNHRRAKTKIIDITMKDFKFIPSKIHIPTGVKVVLKFKNKGQMDHEFLAGRHVKKDGKSFKTDFFSNIHVKMTVDGKPVSNDRMNKNIGTMMFLKPGQHGTMTFTIPSSKAGTYLIGCFRKMGSETHYQVGMKGTLIVGSSAGNV